MNGSCNITLEYADRRYHVLYVGIHSGSGMGANEPCGGRYYLASKDLWEKEKDSYCMVHDSVLPGAWKYYERAGIMLVDESGYQGKITAELLVTLISRLKPEILELFGSERTEEAQ